MIGVDEAGYGPNLGPLCVAVTAWEVREAEVGIQSSRVAGADAPRGSKTPASLRAAPSLDQHPSHDLYKLLRRAVARKPSARRIAIADSKALYKPGTGLALLERGVHAALGAGGSVLGRYVELVECLNADPHHRRGALPWHEGFDAPLPVDATPEELAKLVAALGRASEPVGLGPPRLFARLVFPSEFNDLVDHFGAKSTALSHVTLQLVREAFDALAPDGGAAPAAYCTLDKHGGRNHYGPMVQHFFPEHWVETLSEARAVSEYQWGPPEARVTFAFRARGESCLATALASMTAKYLRELSMRALNEFWTRHLPKLKPTAGYATDARRFRADIAQKQQELGIDDRVLWRNR